MDRLEVARRILRSLCADKQAEEPVAADNYRNTNLALLNLDGIEGKFLECIERYYRSFGGPPKTKTIQESASDQLDTVLKVYSGEVAIEKQEWGANYSALVEKHAEIHLDERLSGALLEISQIQKEGKQTGDKIQKGAKEAVDHAIAELTTLKREGDPLQQPWTKEKAVQVLREQYAERMANPVLAYGLGTGLSPIDEATKGAQNKELWMFAGFVGHGKSTWLINWARYLALEGGFNILFYSLEMDRSQVWRVLATGHCAHSKFGRPLDYDKIKSGTLDPEDADFYLNEVLPDLQAMDGHIEILNPLSRTTFDDVQASAEVINREYPLDLTIIDYIGVLAPTKDQLRLSKGERINENIIRAKQMATDFDHGSGITVASAHQINRSGFKKATENSGIYEMDAIADANECERSSDTLFAIFQDAPMRQKKEAVITNLKNRDGRVVDPFSVYLPAEHRIVAELESMDEEQLSQLLEA